MPNRRYKNISDSTWLRFPDGQTVEPGAEFERDYDQDMLTHHLAAGLVEMVNGELETPEFDFTKE